MLWSKNMQLIDANVILRYILNDSPDMSLQAKKVVENGAYTKPEIIAEVVYVLKGVYQASREEIKVYISTLLRSIQCSEKAAVEHAIALYANLSLDFVDCLLIAYHILNNENVFTFDKRVNKYLKSFLNP